jgi:hypothetical protein
MDVMLTNAKVITTHTMYLCSQGCYGRTEGRTDGRVTISLRNFVGEGIINCVAAINDVQMYSTTMSGITTFWKQ